jgi:hypothetical protein
VLIFSAKVISMADTNGHKSYGFGFFNPDDRLKQIIGDIASAKDLKSLRCTFLLLLEHPEIKPRILERYGEQAFKEMFEKYNITTKAETENTKKKEDAQKKQKIQAFQVLGFSQEDSEKLSELSSEDLKTFAYIKQNTGKDRIEKGIQEQKEKSETSQKIEELENQIEMAEKQKVAFPQHVENINRTIERYRNEIAELRDKQLAKT